LGEKLIMSHKQNNVGCVVFSLTSEKWVMHPDERLPTGGEYEAFVESLEAFIDGYFAGIDCVAPIYCRGDFMGERTEAVFVECPFEGLSRFLLALSRWLAVPKRENWRVVLPADGQIAVYAGAVVDPK